jgi:hypothetical protein
LPSGREAQRPRPTLEKRRAPVEAGGELALAAETGEGNLPRTCDAADAIDMSVDDENCAERT